MLPEVQLLPERTAEFVIVHVRLGLALAPSTCDFVRVCQLELPVGALPGNASGVAGVAQQLKEELP